MEGTCSTALTTTRHVHARAEDADHITAGARKVICKSCELVPADQCSGLRFVTYAGVSPLPQLQWALPWTGPVLVLSLFDGIGALLIALLALGASFAAMCWETDPDAVYVTQKTFRHVKHMGDVHDFDPAQVAVQLRRGHFTAILVAGGSPCQDVSPLHSGRPGLASARSQLFRAVPDIADQCRQVVKELRLSIPVFAMLENVAGCPPEFLQAASAALNGPPVQVSAASFGWTRRKRLFWCSNGHRSAQDVPQPKLPPNVTSQACAGGWRLGWQSKRPWPPSVSFADDFKPRFDPVANAKDSVDGPCFPVFSRAFKHPPDHGPRQDPVVMQRFREHGQWFPLFNYEETALLWKKDQWRVPNSSERAQIMGIPPAALKWVPRAPQSETQAEQVRCSLIGNSFHVPSCMLALIMLFQLCPQVSAIPPAAYVGLEKHVRQNAQDSVWQPGLVDNFPGVLGWTELARLTSRSLAPSGVVLPDLCPSPGLNVALAKLQVYWVDTQMRGLSAAPQGPEWRQQSHVAASKQAVGLQGAGPNAKHASPPLLPPGLGKNAHMQFATCLPNPFDTAAQLDDDSLFACRGMCILGPCIRVWRQQQLRALSRLAKFMRPWDEAICKAMHPDVAAVAKDRKPAFITALTHLLRWPDDTVGLRFFTGFKLLGAIESPGLFRPLDDEVPPPQLGLSALLGKHAADVTLKVESCLPRFPFAAEAKAITLDEVRDGLAAGPFTKSQLDSLFGPGNWIPMRRFMLLQANKLRAIDDGRFSGHNKSCFSEETIYTISPDFVAAACKFCIGLLQDLEDDLPMWAEPHFGTEDMKAAYRQLPNDPDEQAGLFIAFYDPDDQQVKYVHLRAHPFGLSAAVLNFNRVPCLSTAVVRRLAAVAACNYFDDFGVLDFVCARGSGVCFLREAHNLMGLVLDAVKQGPMATQRHFLGILLDLTAALDKQLLRIDLKVGLREALRADIQVMLDQDQCTAAGAAKLRGRLTWAACGMFGRCGRAGQAALVQRQYRGLSWP